MCTGLVVTMSYSYVLKIQTILYSIYVVRCVLTIYSSYALRVQ